MPGRKTKYTPAAFAAEYAPRKATGMRDAAIASAMGINPSTIARYLAKPEYATPVQDAIAAQQRGNAVVGLTRADKLISESYELFELGIREARNKGDFAEARRLCIQALTVARTEADLQRVAAAVYIDNSTTNVNVMSARDILTELLPRLCPECRNRLRAHYAKEMV